MNPIPSHSFFSYTEKELALLPPRPERSHKGTFGRLLCICGSKGMAGAAYLSAKAAYRMGAGLVEILTVEENRIPLQTLLPEAIVTCYSSTAPDQSMVTAAISRADAMVIGCGLGTSDTALTILSEALHASSVPTLLDADALNLIAASPKFLPLLSGKVITPHFKEFSRLTGMEIDIVSHDPATHAKSFAQRHSCVCVLKDHHTVVSDGSEQIYRNTSGNSGMATGGSGDVLSGIIGGLLAQWKNAPHLTLPQLAALGVYIHGRCGDRGAESFGEYSLMASDLIDFLPQVLTRK